MGCVVVSQIGLLRIATTKMSLAPRYLATSFIPASGARDAGRIWDLVGFNEPEDTAHVESISKNSHRSRSIFRAPAKKNYVKLWAKKVGCGWCVFGGVTNGWRSARHGIPWSAVSKEPHYGRMPALG